MQCLFSWDVDLQLSVSEDLFVCGWLAEREAFVLNLNSLTGRLKAVGITKGDACCMVSLLLCLETRLETRLESCAASSTSTGEHLPHLTRGINIGILKQAIPPAG